MKSLAHSEGVSKGEISEGARRQRHLFTTQAESDISSVLSPNLDKLCPCQNGLLDYTLACMNKHVEPFI